MSNLPRTQLAAFDSIQEKLPRARQTVLDVISAAGESGIALHEISERLHWPINCVSGRVTELRKLGRVRDSGRRWTTPSHRLAILWVVA